MSFNVSINDLIETYLKVVHALITVQVASKRIYIEDTKKGHYHFRASDFKKVLTETVAQRGKPEDYMKKFRTLQFIICETNRFTNSRYINGKSTRVITVDIKKYALLFALSWTEIEQKGGVGAVNEQIKEKYGTVKWG